MNKLYETNKDTKSVFDSCIYRTQYYKLFVYNMSHGQILTSNLP